MIKRYFDNASVNRIYLHSAILNAADRINLLFGPVFFLQHGFSVPETCLILASVYVLRFLARMVYVTLFHRVGLKRGLIIGIVLWAASQLLLPFADHPAFLILYLILFASGLAFYWTTYHTFFGFVGDDHHRGKQVSMLNGISLCLMAAAPFFSAWFTTHFGFTGLFTLVAALLLLSIWPILKLQEAEEKLPPLRAIWRDPANWWIVRLHLSESLQETGQSFLWPIAVFLMVGNLMLFGAIGTAGLLLLALVQLVIGFFVDRGNGYGLFKIGCAIRLVQFILRAFFVTTPAAIVASESLTAGRHIMLQSDADYYNHGRRAKSGFWYFYFGEVAWDAGACLSFLAAAGFYALGFGLPHLIGGLSLLGLIGMVSVILGPKPGHQDGKN